MAHLSQTTPSTCTSEDNMKFYKMLQNAHDKP